VSIETEEELEALQAAGRVVAESLAAMRSAVHPGTTTAELDAVAAHVFRRAGARSGPQLDYWFPGVTCISVNDEVVHGIPGPRRLRAGDLVKLDVTAELDGFYADACDSVPVGRATPSTARLGRVDREDLRRLVGGTRRAHGRHRTRAACRSDPDPLTSGQRESAARTIRSCSRRCAVG
jgi:methionyl aminopeptidase